EDPDEDDDCAGEGEQPSDDRASVEEEKADADDERDEREPEAVVAPPAPVAGRDRDLIGQQPASGDGHAEAEEKHAETSGCAAGADSFVLHCAIVAAQRT